jgi:hypothetical protein
MLKHVFKQSTRYLFERVYAVVFDKKLYHDETLLVRIRI